MKDKDRTIILTDENGKETVATILFTYHNEETNDNYVIFLLDEETGECGASKYIPSETGQGKLIPIETDEEWDLIADLIEDYANKQENEE